MFTQKPKIAKKDGARQPAARRACAERTVPAGPLCERVAWPRRAWCALGGPACSLPQRARMHDCQTEAGRGVSWLRARNGTQAQSRNTGSARPPARRALRSMMFEYRSRTQMLKEGDQRSASTPRSIATDPCARGAALVVSQSSAYTALSQHLRKLDDPAAAQHPP